MPRRDADRRTGRPSALTPERQKTIEGALRRGQHIYTACAIAGVSSAAYYRWMTRGERAEYAALQGQPVEPSERVFREFREAVHRARAEAAETMIDVVFESAVGGRLLSEEPALDGAGNPIRDADGQVIMKRTWSNADGRLALSYLKVAQPESYAGAPTRLELTDAGGAPLGGGDPAEGEGDAVSRLAARVRAAMAARDEEDRQRLELEARAAEVVPEPVDVHEAELVEDET